MPFSTPKFFLPDRTTQSNGGDLWGILYEMPISSRSPTPRVFSLRPDTDFGSDD
jgi:hypothetical protein